MPLRNCSLGCYVIQIVNPEKQNTPIRMSSTKKMTPITKKPEITQPHVQPTHAQPMQVQPTQVQPTQSLPKQPILIDLTDEPTPTQQPMTSSNHPIMNLNPSMISKPTLSTPTPTQNPQQNLQLTPQQIAMKRFLATQKLLLEKKLIPK